MSGSNVPINSEGNQLIVDHLYTVHGYSTFNVKVKSGEFTGASNFCIPRERILSITETLSEMHKELKGRCEINDSDSDAYIVMEMDKLGHMYVCGQIGGSHEEHVLKFKYPTDQTVLVDLIRILKTLL